ncbi:Afadin and alpha-actinin-binding-domain-containing protein [Gamsiella multidivaricata]|uniref:Afadin and alpha-actinin-binding-domain-containing protein n=1 Tax=Gamsiella multidivaricata TaxID=101098 RepID=UPI00222070B1|nr:Afadin and alpha-actinin-binding-domain-containing protein [Gamsiella multidivaricata]KAG0367517.1 hypothetical protein BGZ54_003744 [Gamsiella multidivaricata]KAI7817271.1 Afadin and alpha-actinin-binding-domain-containing protein [Gamsiella multidivaricata]
MNKPEINSKSIPSLEGSGFDVSIDEWQDDMDLDQDESYYVPSIPFAQRLAALDPSLYQGSGDDFCTEENFDQTSAYVSHQLGIHGFASNLQFLRADKASAARIVATLYKVLQHHVKDMEYKEEMDLNWRRLSNDYDTAIQNLSTTKEKLEKTERETDILGSRIIALEEELRIETEKHRHTREEVKSSKANLAYAKTQYAHEARKKEQEMNVLKDKVQKSISRTQSSSPSIPGGIKILNPVPRSLYGKQHANDAEQLLKEVIEQQQAKETEIVQENEELRRTLYTVHVELESLIRKHSSLKNTAVTPYGLPFETVKHKIETEIRDTLTLLSDQWNHRAPNEPAISPSEIVVRDQRIEDLQQEIVKMQLELEDSTLLVQGAQKMIDNLSSGNFLAGLQDFKLNVEGSDMTIQEIDEAEAKICKQREDLAKERKKFTESCLGLGKQRAELERAKQEFEESKRTFRLEKVMSFLSFSPRSEKRTMNCSPPSSPIRRFEDPSRKRMATSPLSGALYERSVRPKTQTTVIEVPDEDNEQGDGSVINGEYDEYENEEEEELLRTPSRQRTTAISSIGLEELSRSNHEAAQERLRSGIAASSAPLPNVKTAATASSSAFPELEPSAIIATASIPSSFKGKARKPSTATQTAQEPLKKLPVSRSLAVSAAKSRSFNSTSAAPSSTKSSSMFAGLNSSSSSSRLSPSPAPSRPFMTTVSTTSASASTANEGAALSSQRPRPSAPINSKSTSGTLPSPTSYMSATSSSKAGSSGAKIPSALSKAAAQLTARKSATRPLKSGMGSESFSANTTMSSLLSSSAPHRQPSAAKLARNTGASSSVIRMTSSQTGGKASPPLSSSTFSSRQKF